MRREDGFVDLKRSDANGGPGQGVRLLAGGFGFMDPAERAETLTGVEKGLETAVEVENGLPRWDRGVLDGRTHFPEATVATRIRQAYGGALACENAYECAITLRIQGSGRKTLTCRGNQR